MSEEDVSSVVSEDASEVIACVLPRKRSSLASHRHVRSATKGGEKTSESFQEAQKLEEKF